MNVARHLYICAHSALILNYLFDKSEMVIKPISIRPTNTVHDETFAKSQISHLCHVKERLIDEVLHQKKGSFKSLRGIFSHYSKAAGISKLSNRISSSDKQLQFPPLYPIQ